MSAIKDVYDMIKDLKDLVEKYQDAKMSEKLVDIQSCFFDIREEMENLKDENKRLEGIIKQLEDNSEIEKDLELNPKGFYTKKSEGNDSAKYCATCWQTQKVLIPLTKSIGRAFYCGNCKSNVFLG